MLKVQEIRELIKLIDESTINEFEYELDGTKLTMKKGGAETVTYQLPAQQQVQAAPAPQQLEQAAPAPAASTTQPAPEAEKVAQGENLHKIVSPMVGTFYSSPSPDADVFVQPGSKVSKDSVVCIVEAMKLFNEIEADVKGEIVDVLVKNGELVEYGQPLFTVKSE